MFKDISSQKFGRLTVIERSGVDKSRSVIWLCKCDCGNYIKVKGTELRRGRTTSCGCYRVERVIEARTKHGKTDTRLYNIWQAMKDRCYNKHNAKYKNYGSRGIVVCNEWKDDFEAFYNWAINNNYRDDLTIDRINNDGNYEPNNCRWADYTTQNNNRRNNKH